MKDLWGNEVVEPVKESFKKKQAHAAPPGSGPAGETCGTCGNLRVNELRSGKRFFKCRYIKFSSGPGTDVRKKDAACRLWRPHPDVFCPACGASVRDEEVSVYDMVYCPECNRFAQRPVGKDFPLPQHEKSII